jgi:hypothetical protein
MYRLHHREDGVVLGGGGKLVLAHLVEAGKVTLADVKEAKKRVSTVGARL